MKQTKKIILALLLIAGQGLVMAQIETEVSDEVLLELYRGARVADVVDGLATVGYTGIGVMVPEIAPLWRDVKTMEHRFAGIAVTVRYGPTNHPMHPGADLTKPDEYETYRQWRGMWYNQLSPEPFREFIRPGTVIVMDNRVVLPYQIAFVDKLLSISLKYPNILYCVHNETGEQVEFGDYRAAHLRERAREAGVSIHVTDMGRKSRWPAWAGLSLRVAPLPGFTALTPPKTLS